MKQLNISFLLFDNTDTYRQKVIILKNSKTLPETRLRSTAISSSIYRRELCCRFSLHAFLLLQILVLGVPQLPQA